MKTMTIGLVASAIALGACSSDRPTSELNAAATSISEAQRANAGQVAPNQLAKAQEKLARAQVLSEDGDEDEARLLAQEARADANEAKAAALDNLAQDATRATELLAAQNAEITAELAALKAEKQERGTVITLGDVLFQTDQAALTPEGISRVNRIATYLASHPAQSIVIEGHADATGSATYNQGLSEARAEAVTAALLRQGVTAERVIYTGLGESSPIATNETSTGRQLNRRVEVIFVERG